MTNPRMSIAFTMEKDFRQGAPIGAKWMAPPPGTKFSSTHNRDAKTIYTTGSKFFDAVAYGSMSGSWEMSFVFDYEYLEPFIFAFEKYSYDPTTKTHTFTKANNKRVPSFVIRRKIINKIYYNTYNTTTVDETDELRGCVCKSIKINQGAGTSVMNVTMSGFFCEDVITAEDIDEHDYHEYSSNDGLSEYSCVFFGDISTTNYLANTESVGLSIDNSSTPNKNTCSPFSQSFTEGRPSFSFSTSCVAINPKNIRQRVFTGGYSTSTGPRAKGLRPMETINVASYKASSHDNPEEYPTLVDAYEKSEVKATFKISKCVFKSVSWPNGDGSKMMDQLSSAECSKIELAVMNHTGSFATEHVLSGNIKYYTFNDPTNRHTVSIQEPSSIDKSYSMIDKTPATFTEAGCCIVVDDAPVETEGETITICNGVTAKNESGGVSISGTPSLGITDEAEYLFRIYRKSDDMYLWCKLVVKPAS